MNQDFQRTSGNYSQIDKELQKLQKSSKRWQWGLIIFTIINLIALAWVFDVDKLILHSDFISEKIQVISPSTEDIKIKPEAIFICVGTPPNKDGSANLDNVYA